MGIPNTRLKVGQWGLAQDKYVLALKRETYIIYVGPSSTHDAYIIEPASESPSVIPGNDILQAPSINAIVVSVRAPFFGCLPPGDYAIRPLEPVAAGTIGDDTIFGLRTLKPNEKVASSWSLHAAMHMDLQFVHDPGIKNCPLARPPFRHSFKVPIDGSLNSKHIIYHASGRTRFELVWGLDGTHTAAITVAAAKSVYQESGVVVLASALKTQAALTAEDAHYEYDSMAQLYYLFCTGWGAGVNYIDVTLHDV